METMMMRVAHILGESVVDGPGIRAVAFLQGCPRHCPGCHNPNLLPPEGGDACTAEELANALLSEITPIHRGFTFSGGDPLLQADMLGDVVFLLKRARPDLTIWLYTGYLFEEVRDLPVLQGIDVMVDGPYEKALRDLSLPFRGSSNQRIIDVPASLSAGKAVLWTEGQ
jgi:anaerobic ribonucleoside-triphosphate reductase activating protein